MVTKEANSYKPCSNFTGKTSELGGLAGGLIATLPFGIDAIHAIVQHAYVSTASEHMLAFPASMVFGIWAGYIAPALYRVAMDKACTADEEAKTLEAQRSILQKHSGVTFKSSPHLFLMALPNVFNPHKLLNNLRHPFREMLHTSHIQYPTLDDPETYIVEHKLFGKLVTVDVIERDRFPRPWLLRLKQLFEKDFYYGHVQYFPEPFRLIDRTNVEDPNSFNLNDHVKKIVDNKNAPRQERNLPFK